MLKSIVVVTIAVAQLGPVENAYERYLDYMNVGSGLVSEATAGAWGTPGMVGQPYMLMRAESGHPALLRFIEAEPVEGYAPMQTHGWNATELLVKDPDAIAERLEDSPFQIVGPPADLWNAPNAPRAMQAIGPGNELLYLTRNGQFNTKTAVDRVFIMVLGGPSMAAFNDFYGDRLGLNVSEPQPFQIGVLSDALELSPDTTFPLAIATISEEFLIELDEYPTGVTTPRPRADGMLPPGVAMVGFAVASIDAFELDWRAAPVALPEAPYLGATVAVTAGPAGEWIELIQMPDAE
jgi:catechol 2,3-dioxygenase-like lactoylglutathione lyase family enzyme